MKNMDNLIGQTFGQYTISNKIGQGGMAVVFRARQESLDRDIALKVLLPQLTGDTTFVERFLQEARSAAKMSHSNIVTVYDVGTAMGLHYIALAYIEGVSLADMLQRGPLPPARVAPIIFQIGSALDYAHRKGIIHRDVKPGNILITEGDHAHLADFGIAKAANEGHLTRMGTMVGTPAYMTPEQAMGKPVTPQSDQYALAIVAYEALTGRVPFSADTSPAILYQHVHQPPDLSVMPPPVQAVFQIALAKEASQRFPTAQAFAQALKDAIEGKFVPPPPRSRIPTWAYFVGATAVVIGLFLLFNSQFFQSRTTTGNVEITSMETVPAAKTNIVADTPPTATPTNTETSAVNSTASATPTETPLVATATATDAPTVAATNTPTVAATNTPSPTATPTVLATATPTVLATATATPAPVAAKPAVAPIPKAKATVAVVSLDLSTLQLGEPAEGSNVIAGKLTTFSWTWPNKLPEGHTFEVRLWVDGLDVDHFGAYGVDSIALQQNGNNYTVAFDAGAAYGVTLHGNNDNYRWSVAVVKIVPKYERLPNAESATRRIVVSVGGKDGGGGGSCGIRC